jgi:DtxR family Mn-dependent transcriptional regulator
MAGQGNAELTRSMEDYLEAIYNLKARSDVARVKDIAQEMDVKMPSVTGALHALAQKGLVKHDPYDSVELTEEGLDRARSVADRHTAIKQFLVEVLGLRDEDAEAEACGIEHAIKPETLEKLLRFVSRAQGPSVQIRTVSDETS